MGSFSEWYIQGGMIMIIIFLCIITATAILLINAHDYNKKETACQKQGMHYNGGGSYQEQRCIPKSEQPWKEK